MRILSVQDVTVFRKSEAPLELVVIANGMTATAGWSNARLDNSADPNPADAVIECSFEADRPGIALQVLTPITGVGTFRPANGADAVTVLAKTNSITVHAADFVSENKAAPTRPTTMAVGEELQPTTPLENMFPTTWLVGEEHLPPTTQKFGEELTTLRVGEEGLWTDPRVDDPLGPIASPTFGIGETIGPRWPGDPWPGGGTGPFGGF